MTSYLICCAFEYLNGGTGGAGERPQRARQLWRWMYYHGHWARSADDTAGLQDGFSTAFRHALPRFGYTQAKKSTEGLVCMRMMAMRRS